MDTVTQSVYSHRYAGIVLLVSLTYSNAFIDTGSWSESVYKYQLRVTSIPGTQFKAEQVLPGPGVNDPNGTQTILDRHGIRIIVKQVRWILFTAPSLDLPL